MGFRDIFEKFWSFLQKDESRGGGTGKKLNKFNWLIIVGSVGVLLIILANSFESPQPEVSILSEEEVNSTDDARKGSASFLSGKDIFTTENIIARRLEETLSQIDGVGEVRADVNLASTMEYEHAVNTSTTNKTTDEADTKGGNRTVTEVNEDGELVLIRESGGKGETPVVKKEIKPEVQGVVVVAGGAENPEIKAQLMEAVQVYLNVPPHRVVVLPKESR